MKKKQTLYLAAAAVSVFGLVGAISLSGVVIPNNKVVGEESRYDYVLDATNAPATFGSNVNVPTKLGNKVALNYVGASAMTNGHATLAKDGYISNVDAISDFRSVTAIFTGTLVLNYGKTADRLYQAALTSGAVWNNESGFNYFKVVASDAVTLTSISFSYVCDIQTVPSATAPTITLTGSTSGSAREDKFFTLPTVKGATYDGLDISDKVVIKDETGAVVTGTTYSGSIGTHVLTYSLTDPLDSSLVAATKTVTINVYQRILADGGSSKISVSNEDTNPTVTITDTGIGLRGFYLPAASKQYYYETTVSACTYVAGQIFAAANFTGTDVNTNTFPFYYEGIKLNASDWEWATSKKVTDWSDGTREWTSADYLAKRSSARAISITPNTTAWKLGIARNGTNFYTFVNDKLVAVSSYTDYASIDTIPGLFCMGNSSKAFDATLSAFARLTGTDATSKITTLLGTTTFDYFGLYGASVSNDYGDFSVANGFKYKDTLATNGNGCDDMNGTMVSPYYHLGGNAWTVDMDVKATLIGDSGGWGKFMLDFRTLHDKQTTNMLNLTWGSASKVYEAFPNYCGVGSLGGDSSDFNGDFTTAGIDTTLGKTIHIKVAFTSDGTSVETYAYTFSDSSSHSFTKTVTVTYSGSNAYTFGSQKYIIIHSAKWVGEITNFAVNA
jgi:hypothetical protein